MPVKIIAVDFDGTCVRHQYPSVDDEIGAPYVLQRLVNAGHLLILNTMRSGTTLQEAVDWFKHHHIPLYGVNQNPTQEEWTSSPKVYAHAYIDDLAVGAPLRYDRDNPLLLGWIDWVAVENDFIKRGWLSSR